MENNEFVAKVRFYKDRERDNYFKGCDGQMQTLHFEKFDIYFDGTKADLMEKLAEWTTDRFDVMEKDFIKHAEPFELEPNCLNYTQAEDYNELKTNITEEEPDAYYAMYTYYIEVYKRTEFSL